MKYKAVIFDIDGTLLDTARMNIVPLMKILEKELGIRYAYEELVHLLGYSGTVTLKKMGIPDLDNERVLHEWIQGVQASGISSTPFEGILKMLNKIHNHGLPMGIVSSKEKRLFQNDIIDNHMDHFFQSVILADDTTLHKPHPEPLLACLNKMQVNASEALFIGDSDADGSCAIACGCDFAHAKWGPLPLSVEYTYKLDKPGDILNILHVGE